MADNIVSNTGEDACSFSDNTGTSCLPVPVLHTTTYQIYKAVTCLQAVVLQQFERHDFLI